MPPVRTPIRWSIEPAHGDGLIASVHVVCVYKHYLKRYPDPRSLPLPYLLLADGNPYASNGVLNGVIVFKKPQHHKQQGLFGYDGLPTAWQVLDLARVWVNPIWQQSGLNVFSRMVGMALRRLQWDWLEHHPPRFPDLPYHIELVISYCELSHHDGTAYRACSFARAGLTTDRTKELYYRRLRTPLKAWKMPNGVQLPLLEGAPLIHG